jgi:hypothetical protein
VVLALLTAFAAAPAVGAQDSATISVSADISSSITITACDPTAEFGTGLTAQGAPPGGTTDSVRVSEPGDPILGQGVFYIWSATCDPGAWTIQVESSVSWDGSVCATENSGTSGLSVASGDLRWTGSFFIDLETAYNRIERATLTFPQACGNSHWITDQPSGTYANDFRYALRVDIGASPGDFASTTTWMVTP